MTNKNIIGSGRIASIFLESENYLPINSIIYAKGCSNSQNTIKSEFDRDFIHLQKFIDLIKKNKSTKIFVYYSTYSISDLSRRNNLYVKHKIKMENFIKDNLTSYVILRIPEVITRPTKNNNIINFIYYNILEKKKFDLWCGQMRNFIKLKNIFEITVNIINNYSRPIHSYFINKNYIQIEEIYNILKKTLNEDIDYCNKIHLKPNKFVMKDIPVIDINLSNEEIKNTIAEYYK